ncbi:MAG: non-canonical purine NTP pyrophosphatase [Pseudomonadota bacterium]
MTARATGAAPLRLVLASNNARPLAEMRALLDGLALELVPQGELGIPEADEPHGTFVENALAKARAAARASGGAALADDSGLVVPALGGEPGVVSAEYAGPVPAAGVPDRAARRRQQAEANNALLLQRLHGVPDRRAAFVCTLVAVRHAGDPLPLVATARWEGVVLEAARGSGGFGYDPLLWIPALGASVAELDPARKNRHSHRAQAAAQMRELLRVQWDL